MHSIVRSRNIIIYCILILTTLAGLTPTLIAQEVEPAPSANAFHIQPSIAVNPKDFNNLHLVPKLFSHNLGVWERGKIKKPQGLCGFFIL